MRILDISLTIGPSLITWPGDPVAEVRPAKRIARGDSSNVSELRFGSHTGTHVDPPFHFIDGGTTMDRLPLNALIGDCFVVDLTSVESAIEVQHLATALPRESPKRLLIKSRNSEIWEKGAKFTRDYVHLSESGARWLVESGTILVGTDFLSIEAAGAPSHPVHTTLLGAGVVIVEGLNLSQVAPGAYELACLPLRIEEGDGAPARAVLIQRE